jgi:hypothetical protein
MYQPNYQYDIPTRFVGQLNAALDDMNNSARQREVDGGAERGEEYPGKLFWGLTGTFFNLVPYYWCHGSYREII